MQITKNKVARIEFTLKDDSGTVIDSSVGQEPLAYVHGSGNLIPGLETALEGKGQGESLTIRIPAEEAYGTRDEALLHSVTRDKLPPDVEIEAGIQLRAETDEGFRIITVIKVDGDQVHLDGNHPLAGIALNFDVKVVDTRDATAEEIEHGHVHGPGGHSH